MKLIPKRFKKKQDQDKKLENTLPTNDTLEDHRRHILKTGKKHSRPLSDTQQKIVIISTIIAILIIFSTIWLYIDAVYTRLNTSGLVNSVSKIIPTPVIGVNDSYINYDEVLFQYDTAINVAKNENKEIDKQIALNSAVNKVVEAEVVAQIATEQNILVSDEDINNGIAEPVLLAGGDETFDSTVMDIYGWSRDDFKQEFKAQLLKSRVVTTELYEFSKQANPENFSVSANNLGLTSVVEDTSSADLDPEVAAIFQSLTISAGVSPILYGETGVYIMKKGADNTLEYVSQTYEEVDAFIQERINQSELVTCLNRNTITIENAVKKSWFSCIKT